MRIRHIQTSWTSGELDPRLLGRVDIDQYYKGAFKCENLLAIPHGAISKRIGTSFVDDLPQGKKRLIRFEFNIEQTYLVIIMAGKTYIYVDGVRQTNINLNGSATTNDYIVNSYTESQVEQVDYVQSADTLILVHKQHPPRIVTRTGHTSWTDNVITDGVQATYDFRDTDYGAFQFTCTGGGNFGSQTLTCNTDVFLGAHVGGSFRTNEGYSRITSIGNAKTATINVIKDLDSTVSAEDSVLFSGAVVSLEEPAFNSTKGYPNSVVFHEGRLWYGGSYALPQTMWGSVVGHFFNFEPGEGLADEAIQFTIDTDQVNAITHLVAEAKLQIFTTGGEFFVKTTQDGPVTPSDFSATRIDTFGTVENVKPLIVDAQTVYVNRDDKLIRSLFYEFSSDNYASDLTSLLAPQLVQDPVDMEGFNKFGDEEGHYLLVINKDGSIGCLSILNTERIKSWTKLLLTPGLKAKYVREVENIVYIVVGGLTTGKDSLLEFKLDTWTDANKTFTNTGTTITGLDHLEGREVKVISEGIVFPDATVSGGSITIPRAVDKLEVGLPYSVLMTTMPIAKADRLGPTPLEVKRICKVDMLLNEGSRGVIVEGIRIPDRKLGSDVLNKAPEGGAQYREIILLGYRRIAQIDITQTDPLPFQLLSITQHVDV